jgi:hypothetical protein
MGPAILGGIILLFVLLAYMGAKAWHVWHVVLIVFVFMAACGAFVLTAATMKTQQRWRGEYNSQTTQLERELATQQRLIDGVRDPEPEPSYDELRSRVGQVIVDRGRVWRNLRLANINVEQDSLTLDAANWGDRDFERIGSESSEEDATSFDEPPAEAAAPAAGPAPLGLTTGAIVYAFKEQPITDVPPALRQMLYEGSHLPEQDTKGLCRLPAFYMGEYRIISDPAANPSSIEMTPTIPLGPSQLEQLQQDDGATWVVYEVIPVDSHEALQGLTAAQMQMLLPAPEDFPAPRYEQLIDEYVRDQARANETDPPERKWMRVKFLNAHTIDVDVQTPTPLPDSAYDPSGRSIEATLQQDKPTQFAKGDEAVLDFETAQDLVNQGIAEQVEPVYERRLRDYAEYFRNFARESEATDRQIATAQEDLSRINESLSKLQQQIAFRADEQKKLTQDREGFNRELQVISDYRGALEQQWNAIRGNLSRLYRANKQIVQQEMQPAGRGAQRRAPAETRAISVVR